MPIPNLSSFQEYQPTTSCYLDGRYFNKVFANSPGLIKEPLLIKIFDDNEGNLKIIKQMNATPINNKAVGLLRIIIHTPITRHSTLAMINYEKKQVLYFDPSPHHYLHKKIVMHVEEYLENFLDFELIDASQSLPDVKNNNCEVSGFCGAYIIKFAYDKLLGKRFDPRDIRRFAAAIEHMYGPLSGTPDEEYGWLDQPQNRNLAIGALGGGLIGGLATGSVGGALAGAAIGGLAGYALSK